MLDPLQFLKGQDYEVEKIVDHCDTRRGRQYLVHWLGYLNSDDEWIHEEYINASELIEEYLAQL